MSCVPFSVLQKNLKKDASAFRKNRLALLGNCSMQLLDQALRGLARERKMELQTFDTGYEQITSSVMDENSDLYCFRPDYILLQLCSEKLYEEFCSLPQEQRLVFADRMITRLKELWHRIASRCKASILQFDFPEFDDGTFGSFALKTRHSFLFQIRRLNVLMQEALCGEENVFPVSLNYLIAEDGRDRTCDPKLYRIAKMPMNVEFLPVAAQRVLDVMDSLAGRIRKCAILDLDNTLWGGVIGDDGMENIRIGELGDGRIYSEIQRYFKELKNRGILLAVCSKNDPETAIRPFREHPEMILKEEDFSIFLANWNEKAENIRLIRDRLNIGMDSMVFVDDNPFEREAVRSQFPDLTVPELPEDPGEYLAFLRSENLFETASLSPEDSERTTQYRAEALRSEFASSRSSYSDYLKSIGMLARVQPFEPFHYARIAQLTQRSNQFNLRTVRYTEGEIRAIAENSRFLTLSFFLKDRFGDYGLIGVVILEKRTETELFIDTFLMSCRVLKRGMEAFIFNNIMQCARNHGFRRVAGEYLPTPKNALVSGLYSEYGFAADGNGRFHADTDTYTNQPTFVGEEEP